MTTKQYIGHALCYFIKLVVLVILLYALLFVTGYARISAGFFLEALVTTRQGPVLLLALAVLSAVYPMFGFVRRESQADITDDREKIINAFISTGYSLKNEVPGEKMVFRFTSPLRRIVAVFDDKITVTATGEGITLEGRRREIIMAQLRIETYIRNSRNNE